MNSQLKERISKLSDEELLEMVESKASDYPSESLGYAAEELEARGIPFSSQASVTPYECEACGADVSFDDQICPKCGADISEVVDSPTDENTGSENPVVETRYPALRGISVILRVLAVLAAIAGLIGALVGLIQMLGNTYGAPAAGGLIVLVSLLYGGLGCLYALAISEGITVFIDIEANTRLTNNLLRKLLDR
ncbi:MAG TPA: zinc ribbon domain-containing protein [Pyrinomonadaceae bacterium]|nr:zinc ribbon domain-containing protein [Pyrinomonadaceae bacterium]